MKRPYVRRITLADMMILVATTAFGLACYVLIDDALFRGQRYLFGLFKPPQGGWSSTQAINRAAGVAGLLLPVFGGWTLALPWLGRGEPWRRRSRRAGVTASLAAQVGMGLTAAVAALGWLLRRAIDGTTPVAPNFWVRTPYFDILVIFAGLAVASAWATQALAGRWRTDPGALDRIGRFVGVLWIAAGMVFAVRLFLG